MAIISSYPTVAPSGSDLVIGTDISTTPNSTKTFTIDSINALATATPAAGTLNTVALFTGAVAVGDSTIVRSGAGATSVYTFGGGTAIDNTSITTTSFTASGAAALGTLTMTGDIVLPDNAKLEIGSATGGDLQIYHDGSNSYIDEQGTGNLIIKGSTNVLISTSSGAQLAQFADSGSAFLYYNGSLKLSTVSSGVSIDNGSLTVQGSAGNNGQVTLAGNGVVNGVTSLRLAVGSTNIVSVAATGTTTTGQINIAALNTAPASATATGVLGEIRFTADHIYVCVGTSSWKRVAIAAF